MALVPSPAFSGGPGPEVSATQVHDAGGEAQQAAVSVGPVHPGGGGGQAVLLVGAGQQVEGPILQVGCLLDELGVQDKVGSGCRGSRLTVCITVITQQTPLCPCVCGLFFRLTLHTRHSCGSAISSSGTVDVRVSATLLKRHLGATAVSPAQHHLTSI